MPDIRADIEFLARHDKYGREKPYKILLGEDEILDADVPVSNLEFVIEPEVEIRDMRDSPTLSFDRCGFEYVAHHQSAVDAFETYDHVATYQEEIRDLLSNRFDALEVVTYETKLRQNSQFDRQLFDINDALVIEGPAKGAHVDVTTYSARAIVKKHLSEELQRTFLRPGYRLRIVNTWRPMNAILEDRPLALCDSQTVMKEDLASADMVLPDKLGEIYYLHHAHRQQWYWLEKQKKTEPFIFLMYDNMASENLARLCPHVSFSNPRAPSDAPIRSSVETRSIVISRIVQNSRRVSGSATPVMEFPSV